MIDEFDERVLLGEIFYLPIERLITYYGKGMYWRSLPLQFCVLNGEVGRLGRLLDWSRSMRPPFQLVDGQTGSEYYYWLWLAEPRRSGAAARCCDGAFDATGHTHNFISGHDIWGP